MRGRMARYAAVFAVGALCALLLGSSPTTPTTAPAKRAGPGRHGRVLIVPIHGAIDRVRGAFLHRAISGAKGRYDAVLFDIDTPGGRVDIMSKMSDDIVELSPTPTIAFVSNEAMSAGAFIAMSADRIYMKTGTRIGAARGWVPDSTGLPAKLPESVDEKLASALRAQFRGLVESKERPHLKAIAEAMTDEKIEVTKVRLGDEVKYVTGKELENLQNRPGEAERLEILEVVSEKGRLLTFTAGEAEIYDLTEKTVEDLEEVLATEGLEGAQLVRKVPNWSDRVVGILTAPQVVGLLILIGFGGIWLEMKIPGFGVPGTIAVVAFLLVFSSQFLVGNANAGEILLFITGLALLAIELFVTPGFGLMGGAGIACLFLSLLLAMQPFTVPETPWQVHTLQLNLLATVGGVAGSLLLLLIFAWVLPTTPIFNRLTLRKELKAEDGFGSGVAEGEALVGQVGTVVADLRPAGKMRIGDELYSVVSDAEFVEPGGKARVIRVDGPKIIVEPEKPEKPSTPEFKA